MGYTRPGFIPSAGTHWPERALACDATSGPSFGTSISHYRRHVPLVAVKRNTSTPLGPKIHTRASSREDPEPSSAQPDGSTSGAIEGELGNHTFSSLSKGVARRILSDESLEGGSMLPFLTVSEAYWKVRERIRIGQVQCNILRVMICYILH